MTLDKIVFVGLNGRVAALDRDTGELLWKWDCPHSSGYVSLLVDRDRLIASVNGYTHCLDPFTGIQLWENTLKGFGTGPAAIATVFGQTPTVLTAVASHKAAQDSAAMAATVPVS
jgi:outer membrane protein assembly factor BamB